MTHGTIEVGESQCGPMNVPASNACDGTCDGLYSPWKNECSLDCWNRLREQEIRGDFQGVERLLATERDDVRQGLIRAFQFFGWKSPISTGSESIL